jgi:hypothetical protein
MERKSNTPLTDRINEKRSKSGEDSARVVARERAAILAEVWDHNPSPRFIEGRKVYKVAFKESKDGNSTWVDVWFTPPTKNDKPSISVSNPPMLAADPEGFIRIPGSPYRYSEDPVRAVVQMVVRSMGEPERERG